MTCRMCGRTSDGMDAWHTVVHQSLVGDGEREETHRVESVRGHVPWARIGEMVGQRNLAVTAKTYAHVLMDEGEVQYAPLLANA